MLKNLKKALPLGLLISGAIATSAIAGSYTLRVGSGHPSAPTAYVTGMEKVFVPNIKKRVAAETKHKIKIIEAYAGKIAKVHETLEAVEKGLLDIGSYCVVSKHTQYEPMSSNPFSTASNVSCTFAILPA